MTTNNKHTTPWPQTILYGYNMDSDIDQFYEEETGSASNMIFRIASRPARMNCLFRFNSTGQVPKSRPD